MDVPELIPMDDYNPKKAQLQTYIHWLLSKAYGNGVPQEAEQPFYYNNQGLLCLKPGIANGLTSADLYCRACTNIFKDANIQWQGHWSIIQALSRKGIYVVEGKDSAVTETSLLQTSPFKINSHLALIRSLMTAYIREIVSIERVVQAVKKFASVNASNELPYDPEDALLFWINKVCSTLRHRLERELQEKPYDQIQREEDNEVGVPDIPVMDDLLKDLNDGCCLAALISFYCPDTAPLTEVALGNQLAIADSLHNLQLIQKFIERYLPVRCLHMNINDLFYTPEQLKVAVTVFLAEVFYWLEVNPVPSVRDVSKVPYYLTPDQDTENRARPDTAKQIRSSSAGRTPPISNATKRSFQAPDQGNASDPNAQLPPPRQPLLPKRVQQRNSLHDADFRFDPNATRQSVRAWEDDGVANGRPHGDGPHGDGPHGDGPHGDGPRQSESPSRGRVRPSSANPQLQSSGLTSVTSANSSGGLLSNVSIDPEMSLDTDMSVDLGDTAAGKNTYRANPNPRRNADDLQLESLSSRSPQSTGRGQVEPLMPAKLKPSKEKSANPMTKEYESGENKKPTKPMSLNFGNPKPNDSSSSDTTPEEDYQTPSVENVPLPGEHLQSGAPQSNEGEPRNSKSKQFDAFFVDTQKPAVTQGSSPNRRTPKQTGKAQGEPHEADRRSNGEAFYLNLDDENSPQRPDSLLFQASSSNNSSAEKPSPKTSFAQIKKQKDSGEVSPILYQSPKKGALKGDATSAAIKGQKKTTFAALPNQTTWQESAQKSNVNENPREGDAGEQPMTTELINLRMQLEERRRQMETEKQRMAMQWNKQRQRMSKQAFIQVVTKKDDGNEGEPKVDSAAEAQKQKEAEKRRKEEEERRKLEEKRREEAKREEERRKEEQRKEEERQREKERQEEEQRRERERLEREELEREEELRRAMEKEKWEEKKREEEKKRQKEEKRRQKDQKKEEERIERERVEERLKELERQREIEAEKLRELERQRNLELSWEGSARDNGRSKWSTPPSNGRPMSFHEATPPPYQGLMSTSDHDRSYPPAPESTSSADSTSTSGEYGTSLDRLNLSLNELQGEIMRLSLQQDHIKSLVNEPRTMSPSPGEQPSQKNRDKFYPSAAGEGDMSSSTGGDGPMRTSGGYSGSYPDPMRTSGGYNSATPMAAPPMYPQAQGMPYGGPNQMYGPQFMPPGYPHPYMPPGQPPPSTYPVGMQQYPQAMYQQPGMYQGAYQGQWPPGVPPPPHLQPGAPYPPTSQPPAQTHTATAQTYAQSPASEPYHDYSPHSPEGASSPINRSSPIEHSPGDATNPDALSSPSQRTDAVESHGEGEDDQPSSPQQPPPNKGFFVSFEIESPSPRKQKPKLPISRKKESSSSPVRKEVVPPPITAKPDAPDLSDLIQPEKMCNVMSAPPTSPPGPVPAAPAEAFVIDAEGPTQDEIDFEKKRQKVLEMQMKRREETEKKKAKMEAERLKKAEKERSSVGSHRAKQEMSEQKKADDKARREQIFQQYLARKAEREASEEESKAGLRDNVPRRQRQQGKKTSRPHSQPPSAAVVAATDDKHSVSSQSHSSQEDLSAKGHVMSTSASKITPPEEGVDGSYLSFGGMTHRRPPSPGWARSPFAWRSTASNSLGRNFSGKRSAAVGEGDSNSLTSNNAAGATSDYSGRSLPLSSRLLSGSVSSLATAKVVAPPIKSYGGSTTSLVSKPYGGSMTSLSAKYSASTTNLSSRSGINGPKLFVKPSSKSNRNIISNALSHCCLAGIVNTDVKNKVLDEVGRSDAKHFLILFRDHGQQYRAIYSFEPDTEVIMKISGNGPKSITNGMVERFYKYNSGAKSFTEVKSTKHISVSIDAITLYNHFWQKKLAPSARKANLY